MALGTQGVTHWSEFTGDALKVDKLLVKLRFTEESAKSIVGYGLDSGEELEHLYDNMCKSFVKTVHKPSADQKGVVVSTMAEVFLGLLVRVMQHMKRVSRTIDIDTTNIEWCRVMNN